VADDWMHFASGARKPTASNGTEVTSGCSSLGLADALCLQAEPRSVVRRPFGPPTTPPVRSLKVSKIFGAFAPNRRNYFFFFDLRFFVAFFAFFAFLAIAALLAMMIMAVSEQCLRESQALHPDYYRTNKKTLLRLNEACKRRQNMLLHAE
jgi:hypothetical protein